MHYQRLVPKIPLADPPLAQALNLDLEEQHHSLRHSKSTQKRRFHLRHLPPPAEIPQRHQQVQLNQP